MVQEIGFGNGKGDIGAKFSAGLRRGENAGDGHVPLILRVDHHNGVAHLDVVGLGGLLVEKHLVGVFGQAAGDEPIANTHGGVLVVPGHDPHPAVPGLKGFPVGVGQHEPHPVLDHDVFDLGVVPQLVKQRPPNAPEGIRGIGVLGHLGHDRGRIRGDDRIHTCERVFDRGVEHCVE